MAKESNGATSNMNIAATNALYASAVTPATITAIYSLDLRVWLLAYIVALLHAVLFGLPAFLVCKSKGWTQWWHSLICGFFCGVPFVLLMTPWGAAPISDFLLFVIQAGLLGMSGGLTAWLVWRRGHADSATG